MKTERKYRTLAGEEDQASPGPDVYDVSNIFAKILRGEAPCDKVYEDDLVLAFKDANPVAPTHILVVPKGAYVSYADFSENASDEEVIAFFRTVGKLAKENNLTQPGFRVLANHGANAGQTVPHFHVHLFGGRPLGGLVAS